MAPDGNGFAVAAHPVPGGTRLVATGELDFRAVDEFTAAVSGAGALGLLELDLSGLTFIDSGGLNCLILLAVDAAEHDRRFVIVALSPQARRLLEMTGLDRVLEIRPH